MGNVLDEAKRMEKLKQDGQNIMHLIDQNAELSGRVEKLERELNGTEHKYGYKQMYGICNQDYAALNSEKNRYKQALEDMKRILDTYPHVDYSKNVTRRRLFDLARQALEGTE